MSNETGETSSDEDAILTILREFYPKDKRPYTECLNEFNKLLSANINYKLNLDLDFENKPAEYFIIADLYLSKADLLSLHNHLAKKKRKTISVQMANQVKNEFLNSVSHFKDKYEWIYNPPMVGNIAKYTLGKQLRQDFQQHYGAYAEITYLLSKGDAMKFDEINKMKLENYLSLGEYLLRKRTVENIE